MHSLRAFLTVAEERSFSRAAEKLHKTQPAVSLAIQRLEAELGERLFDRSGRELLLTDAGALVLESARRFDRVQADLRNALTELRDRAAGRLTIGANESTTVYLLDHIGRYRSRLPKIHVEVRRCLSSRIPAQLLDGELELGLLTYDPDDERLASRVLFTDHLAFIVSRDHRLAKRSAVSIQELGKETFIAHNVMSPYRNVVLREFRRYRVDLHMPVEMPTVEAIRRMVERNEGVAFVPRMCVGRELEGGLIREVRVRELAIERKIRLVSPANRTLSYAARAFLEELSP